MGLQFLKSYKNLKGLFHPACLAPVVSWFAFVVAIFMGRENGDKQRPTKRRHVQGMLDETAPLIGNQILRILWPIVVPRDLQMPLFGGRSQRKML